MDAQPLVLLVLSISLIHFWVWFVAAIKLDYFSLVDVVWAFTFPLIAICFLILLPFDPRLYLLCIMVSIWGMRLGVHLWVRLAKHYPEEDSRYVELRTSWSENLHRNFFFFFAFQSVSVLLLFTPFILAASSKTNMLGLEAYIGLGLWLVAWVGESLADRQLAQFREKPENKGEVCKVGLWRYSRHPNYFFEWVMWVAYAVVACRVDHALWVIVSPLMMLIFLTKITGIPYAEKMSLKSRGDKFREYQRTTSVFIPWFPKS